MRNEKHTDHGTLTTCWEPFQWEDGSVTLEKIWLYLERGRERRFLGLVSEMTDEQAATLTRHECNVAGCWQSAFAAKITSARAATTS
jgi:hypothetical protein